MTALTAPKPTVRLGDVEHFVVGVKADVNILAGALVVLASGYARPGRAGQGDDDAAKIADAATYVALGVAQETVTGSAVDGEVKINVVAGPSIFANSAGVDAITALNIGAAAFVVDDQTVALTSAGGTRAPAGRILGVSAEGVAVDILPGLAPGRRTVTIPFAINETDTLAATSAELISPVSGTIQRLSVIVQKAVTTGGDVTAAISATAIAGLACTIADGAAKGTIVTDTPTLGDVTSRVTAGQRLQIIPGAPFNGAGAVSGFIEIAV